MALPMSNTHMFILGHRGEGMTNRTEAVHGKRLQPRNDAYYGNQVLPENSLPAFEHALLNGADGIECDIFLSKDGIPMVIHDNELVRNVDGYHDWQADNGNRIGLVSDFTCCELQNSARFSIGDKQKIPTLDELMQLLIKYNATYRQLNGHNYTINIELKNAPHSATAVYGVIKKYINDPHCPFTAYDFLISSFYRDAIREMHALDPSIRSTLSHFTERLHEGNIIMPGWITRTDRYPLGTTLFLDTIITDMHLAGLDVVTSDAVDDLMKICMLNHVSLNAATHSFRLKQEAMFHHTENQHMTDVEREKQEVERLATLSAKYGVSIYYKADNPGIMKQHLISLNSQQRQTTIYCNDTSFANTEWSPQAKHNHLLQHIAIYEKMTADETRHIMHTYQSICRQK